jgi:hypothetical protein
MGGLLGVDVLTLAAGYFNKMGIGAAVYIYQVLILDGK